MFNYNCDLDLDLVTILHMGWPKWSTSWELMSHYHIGCVGVVDHNVHQHFDGLGQPVESPTNLLIEFYLAHQLHIFSSNKVV